MSYLRREKPGTPLRTHFRRAVFGNERKNFLAGFIQNIPYFLVKAFTHGNRGVSRVLFLGGYGVDGIDSLEQDVAPRFLLDKFGNRGGGNELIGQ